MIYLDNNATTRTAPEVFGAIRPFLTLHYGNPSSSHAFGQTARRAVEHAREQCAALLNARDADEIVFTGCGTESNYWAITGALELQPDKRHIITTEVEHEVVARTCDQLERRGYLVTRLGVNQHGLLDLAELRDALASDTALVSIMAANNETGVLFPILEAAAIVKEHSSALVHVDGVQAPGKIPIDLQNTAVDLFAIAGHKFHAPKGVGALYIRRGVNLPPLLIGGGQESRRRAGTEAVPNIVGLGAACELARVSPATDQMRDLRNRLETEILNVIPNARLNGSPDSAYRLPNTANISFTGIEGESILALLDAKGIAVSTGSACNSETHTASPVLKAMDVPYVGAMGAIRFSLSRYTTNQEVTTLLEVLPSIIAPLAAASPLML